MSRSVAARHHRFAQLTLVVLSLLPLERVRAQDALLTRPYVFLMTAPEGVRGLRFATLEAAYVDNAFQPIANGGQSRVVRMLSSRA